MTDAVGIMQHAVGSKPDPAHGYCVDDVARALQVDLLHGRELGWPAVAERARHNLDFLAEAFDEATGRFRNFRSVDGSWTEGVGSEDCQGRAFHALGDVIADAPDARIVESATSLFEQALPAALGLTALRAQSSVLLGGASRNWVPLRTLRPPRRVAPWPTPSWRGSRPVRIRPGLGRNHA